MAQLENDWLRVCADTDPPTSSDASSAAARQGIATAERRAWNTRFTIRPRPAARRPNSESSNGA